MNNGNPNIQVLKANKTGIFTNYIYKAIPLAFDESMSYYECLCGLLKYLKDTIIPTVNNNAEAVEELQGLYVELKNYVDNYFESQDWQEMIDNKLDEMTEDGTLQNLLNNYTQLTKVYDTYSDMINDETLVNNQKVKTLGYYTINDGGGAYYYITNSVNNDAIQFITANDLYANLVIENNTLYSKQFGLKGDGVTDETTALQTFYNYINYTKVLSEGMYIISNTLYIKGVWRRETGNNGNTKFIFNNASFKYTGSANGYSIILYNMYKQEIDGLCITQDSTINKVGLIGCWFLKLTNIITQTFNISNDVSILNSREYSSLSNEYLDFNSCTIQKGLVFDTINPNWNNAIHFYNSNISNRENPYVITVNGAISNQDITFYCCDISYATTAYFNIVNEQTGRGNISCLNCYFDTAIKMYANNDPKNMQFTFIGNMLASASNYDKTNIRVDSNMLQNVVIGGKTHHGYFLPTMNFNLAKNGNFESSTEIPYYAQCIISQTSTTLTKEWITSARNINNRARKITFLTDTANQYLQILAGTTAPYKSEYTVFIRFMIKQWDTTDKPNFSMSVGGNYVSLQGSELELDKEYILIHNKDIIYDEGANINGFLYINNPKNLILEIYEIGIIPGKMYIPNAPLHATSKVD